MLDAQTGLIDASHRPVLPRDPLTVLTLSSSSLVALRWVPPGAACLKSPCDSGELLGDGDRNNVDDPIPQAASPSGCNPDEGTRAIDGLLTHLGGSALLIPSEHSLPPLECCSGVKPNHTAKTCFTWP
jgi:hypothetical protein